MKVSIVLPIYKEKENVAPMIAQITEVMMAQNWDYEIIAVDDGSTDGSTILPRLRRRRFSVAQV